MFHCNLPAVLPNTLPTCSVVAAHAHPLLTRSPPARPLPFTRPLMPLCLCSFASFAACARPCVRLPSHRYALPYRACTIAEPCHAVLMLIPTPHHTILHTDDPVPNAQLSIHSTSLPESPSLHLRYTSPQSTKQPYQTKLYQTKATPIPMHLHHQLDHATHLPTHPPTHLASPIPIPIPISLPLAPPRLPHFPRLVPLPHSLVSAPQSQPADASAPPTSGALLCLL
jgi:hypothetical protein